MTKDFGKEVLYALNGVKNNKFSIIVFEVKKFIKNIIPYKLREFYRINISSIYKPQHSRLRKVIPKYWVDLDFVLIEVNFEIIKSFYEDEYLNGWVDWESDESHKKFSKWLKKAYNYILVERPKLKQAAEDAYPEETDNPFTKKMNKSTYKELYGEVDRLEKLIHDTDTKIITDLVKYRDFLWT